MFAKTTLILAAVALSSPLAAKAPQAPQIAVGYSDLDLTTAAGVATLKARVRAAAKQLCPRDPGHNDLVGHRIATQCISEASVTNARRMALAISSARGTKAGVELAAR